MASVAPVTGALASALAVTAANSVAPVAPSAPPLAVVANDNRIAAGTYIGDTLVLRLTVATVAWHLLGDQDPALTVAAFAEEGKTPTIPAPLVRVRAGTPIHAVIRNTFDDTLIVRGFSDRNPAVDSIILLPNTTREVTFSRATPGTFQYWATLAEWQRNVPLPLPAHKHGLMRPRFDSQLTGAFIVDPPGRTPNDRIFVITETVDQAPPIRNDPRGMPGREFTAINGRSWPYTERLHYAVGDTIHWRIINATFQSHPMHLHGFYFRVDASGSADPNVDSIYTSSQRRTVVTEGMKFGGDTRDITWSPDRPGNWIFHCHLASHNTRLPRIDDPGDVEYPVAHDHGDPDHHAVNGMNGLILGITVDGKEKRAASWHPAKRLHLFVQSDSAAGDSARRFGYVLQRGDEPRRDSVESPGPLLVLTRGEPTSIEVTNRTLEPTSVHWHGIELESYYDGVAGWSGRPGATEPAIRPGSSFEVHITPRRAGTFMYHTHFNDMRQQYGGLAGALVVLEPGQKWDSEHEVLAMISDGPHATFRVNGSTSPPTRVLRVGNTYRIRIADAAIYHVHTSVRLLRDSTALTWRAIAKDGFPLPPEQAKPQPSATYVASGETADFEFTPDAPGDLRLEVERPPSFKFRSAIPLHVVANDPSSNPSTSAPHLVAPTSTAAPAVTRQSQIILFGTGTPIIDAAHSGPSIGILIAGSLYIFDAGPGVERRMLEAVAKGIKIDTVPAVFITHLHSDHTLGLPALVYYHGPNATFRRGGPLTIYGPPGIAEMMDHINAAWAPDRAVRSQTGGAAPSWQVRGADVSPGIVYRDSNIVVKAFEVPHTLWPHAYGYRVEAPDRTIVISGDTRPSDAIARECAGCDVLLHEVYSAEGFKKIPARVQPYHSSAHTSTYELAEIATKAQPKLLVLYHELYFSGATEEDLLREIRSRYSGRVVAGHDLDVY